MSNKRSAPIIAGLDIGSSKVTVVIGQITDDSKLEVVGLGTAPNVGIRQGVVVNIEATTEAIRKAREEAELMSGYRIEEVLVAVSGSHIKSFDSKGMVAIKNKEVNHQDVERVIEAAKAVAVPNDRVVLHVIPREFKVDGQDGILDPIGMSGIRLEASVHIVTGSSTAISNNLKCIEKAGMKSAGLVLEQLASSLAVLSEDEKTLGVCVVDMGAGSCHLIYYIHGSVAHTSVVPVGGAHFTHDIAIGLRTPQIAAEALKVKYGSAMATLVNDQETIEVEGVGGRKARTLKRMDLAEVIEPRAEETLQMLYADLRNSKIMHQLGSGVVLTGGASQLEGLVEMGEFMLDLPVRRGVPGQVGGLSEVVKSSAYSAAVGLLLFGLKEKKFTKANSAKEEMIAESINSFGSKVKNFFEGLF
ncbi:MAG: cell division protein FtsA [Proteobacteria bacterium]|jgi:cell division protein FtsA|nr:cell division protein FtsA [Pseudomonadota bacterium]